MCSQVSSATSPQLTHARVILGACRLWGWLVRGTNILHRVAIRAVFILPGVTVDAKTRPPPSPPQLWDSPPGVGFLLAHWRLCEPRTSFLHPSASCASFVALCATAPRVPLRFRGILVHRGASRLFCAFVMLACIASALSLRCKIVLRLCDFRVRRVRLSTAKRCERCSSVASYRRLNYPPSCVHCLRLLRPLRLSLFSLLLAQTN